jgi:UDP-3-O-[3-hydroxymyristoyl] glucosamine N-acyltransferase
MYQPRKNKISIKKIAKFLKTSYTGKDFDITSLSSLNNVKNNSLLFYAELVNYQYKIKDNVNYDLKKLEKFKNIALITTDEIKNKINIPIISSENPRLDFQRVAMKFFTEDEFSPGIHKTAVVEKSSTIGKDVYIGPHCYIGNNVKIGDKTKILANVCIYGKTQIGSNSVILSNTTIGSEGFSFYFTGDEFFHFPHFGSILIGDNVWVGSNCTVEKSQMDQTIIEDHVKIDDLVHIGHNSIVKKYTQITAGSIISGRVKIGKSCWIAPNSVIDPGCEIGDNCFVGTSSLVRSNFPENSVIVGSPAKFLKKMFKDYNGK